MPRWKPNYKEGDWIALPLIRRGGWGLGLVARCKSPTIIGYFFGPRFAEPPTMVDTLRLRRDSALIVADLGDLGFRTNEWLVIGHQPNWNRGDWPLPLFAAKDGPRLYLCTLQEEDPTKLVLHHRITQEEADRMGAIPREVYGYKALSITLDKLLAEREAQTAATSP